MSFLFPTLLTIGLPLVGVPILIHLINLRRQQRIRWAAMQFLLESQRRNRRWILLKQLLLLGARMAAIAVVVLMLSHLVLRNEWMKLLGGGTTHHVVLVDDSYSMGDRWESTSAYAQAKRAVQAIVDQAAEQSSTQLVTLLRFTESAQLSAGAEPKVFSQRIDDEFRSRLETVLASWKVSETDIGAADALKALPRIAFASDEETLILYVVSDFRARQFANSSAIRKLLADLNKDAAQIHLVRCVREGRPNLAITALEPESGVRAAGVEMWMNVRVANYGKEIARGVTVQLEQDGDALPALALEDIPPRDEVSHKFRVQFAGTGSHWLSASLEADAVEVDNRRYFAVDLPAARLVLIIDGSKDGLGGRQLSLALAPGGNTRTGWQPHIEPASFLADAERLDKQAAVCLLDVPRLADDELESLERYVEAGGGVAFFVGPEGERAFYNNRLYHNGEGLFPAPLKLPTQLLDSNQEGLPDIQVSEHPLFRVLAGRRNSFLPLILVDYYYALADDWQPDEQSSAIVTLRNDEPLVLEKRFGGGKVIAHLTMLSSSDTSLGRWTNWSLNPAFPVLANELVSYLASGRDDDPTYRVGDDLVISTPENAFDPMFRFVLPGEGRQRSELPIAATPVDNRLTAVLPHVAASGVYEVQLQPVDGAMERRDFAFNVPTGEGDLEVVHRDELAEQLAGINFRVHDAAEMAMDEQRLAGFEMSGALLAALIVILVGEQLLAYMASYHIGPVRGSSR